MKSDSNRPKRIAFGAAIGVGVGLLVDSALLVPTSIYFLVFVWPVIVPPMLGLAVGALLGWVGWMPSASWRVSLFGSIVLWALCVWIPVKIRAWQFNTLAHREIPVFPGARLTRSYIEPYMADGGSEVHLEFCVGATTNEVLKFYQNELVHRGWTGFPKKTVGGIGPYDWYPFSKRGRYLSLYVSPDRSLDCSAGEGGIQIHCNVYNFIQRREFLPNGWP